LTTLSDLEPLKTCLGINKKCGACGFDANSFGEPIEAAPQTDVSASKMLHHARMSAMTGRTAAFRAEVEWQLWADHANDEIEKRSDCCAMQISTRRAESGNSLRWAAL
jgi:bacterioferritin-associated ferredoxin